MAAIPCDAPDGAARDAPPLSFSGPSMSHVHKIAAIAGDGIGNEVLPEGLRAVQAAARRFGLTLQIDTFPWACLLYTSRCV